MDEREPIKTKFEWDDLNDLTLTLFGLVTTAGLWTGGLAVMMGRLPQRVTIVGLVLFNTVSITTPINERLCKPLVARAGLLKK